MCVFVRLNSRDSRIYYMRFFDILAHLNTCDFVRKMPLNADKFSMRLNARGLIASRERERVEQRELVYPVRVVNGLSFTHTVVNQFPINPMSVVNRMPFTHSLSFIRILLSLTVCSQPSSICCQKFSANTVY